ncbi:hypothetical protein ACJX0J_006953, partial [Zea mays]
GVEEADGNKPTHPTPYQVFDAAASPNNEMLLMHDSGARRISIVVELHEVDFPLLLLCSVWMTLCCLRYNFPFPCLSNVNLNTLMNMFSVLGDGGGLGGRNASNGSGPPCLRLPRDVHAAIAREQLRQPHRRVAPALVSQARVTVAASPLAPPCSFAISHWTVDELGLPRSVIQDTMGGAFDLASWQTRFGVRMRQGLPPMQNHINHVTAVNCFL